MAPASPASARMLGRAGSWPPRAAPDPGPTARRRTPASCPGRSAASRCSLLGPLHPPLRRHSHAAPCEHRQDRCDGLALVMQAIHCLARRLSAWPADSYCSPGRPSGQTRFRGAPEVDGDLDAHRADVATTTGEAPTYRGDRHNPVECPSAALLDQLPTIDGETPGREREAYVQVVLRELGPVTLGICQRVSHDDLDIAVVPGERQHGRLRARRPHGSSGRAAGPGTERRRDQAGRPPRPAATGTPMSSRVRRGPRARRGARPPSRPQWTAPRLVHRQAGRPSAARTMSSASAVRWCPRHEACRAGVAHRRDLTDRIHAWSPFVRAGRPGGRDRGGQARRPGAVARGAA